MSRFNPHSSYRNSEFPPPDEPISAELVEPSRWRMWAGLLTILVFIALGVGPLLYYALPGEMSRWQIATAQEKRLDGDLAGAIQELDRALENRPDDIQLIRKRAQWQLEQDNYTAALEDCNRILSLRPRDPETYILRSEVLAGLGRHEEAVADWKVIMNMGAARTKTGRPQVLNGLAYYRGLANMEIDEALVDIDEAMRELGENHQMLDTRGYLYYRKGDFDRALHDLNRAVDMAEEEYNEWNSRTMKKGFGPPDRREQNLEDRTQRRLLAVIRYHRGLVHQQKKDQDQADRDFQRVTELGFQPGEKLF